MVALYTNSFAAVLSHPRDESVTPDGWNTDDIPFQLIDPTTTPIDPDVQISPTPNSFSGIPAPNPTYPPQINMDPNIEPSFYSTYSPSKVRSPVVRLTTPDSFQDVPTLNPTHDNMPIVPTFFPSGAATPVLGPSISLSPVSLTPYNPTRLNVPIVPPGAPTLVGSTHPNPYAPIVVPSSPVEPSVITTPVGSTSKPEAPRPRPRPRKKTKNPIISSTDPNPYPTTLQEEDLGRPKRIPKRKTDIYLEAEEKNDLAKQKRKK
jgi:hypothetical protein